MFKNKEMFVLFGVALAIVVIVCLMNNIGGLTFVILVFLCMCGAINYYNGLNRVKDITVKKYKGYQEKVDPDIYYDSKMKTLRKKVISKEIDNNQYMKSRDELTRKYNEGKLNGKDES